MRRFRSSRRLLVARVVALVVSIGLVPTAVGLLYVQHQATERDRAKLDSALTNAVNAEHGAIEAYFARARAVVSITAHNPAFADFYRAPGARHQKVRRGNPHLERANAALAYLEELYPDSIGEACFIDRGGAENARAVRGRRAPVSDLSPDETGAPFFRPSFAQAHGEVFQSRPYVSPDTGEWVVSNTTLVPSPDGRKRAIVHFEVTIESFRRASQGVAGRFEVTAVEARSGAVIFAAGSPQRVGARLGRPGDRRFEPLVGAGARPGMRDLGGLRVAYRRVGGTAGNANTWFVVASAPAIAGAAITPSSAPVLLALLAALVLVGCLVARRWLRRSDEAATDPLTGLPNRRRLYGRVDEALVAVRRDRRRAAVMLIDLDRFKEVNDALGHHHGDALLVEIGRRLDGVVRETDVVARLGGDEFAVLLPAVRDRAAAVEVAEKLLAAIAVPLPLADLMLETEASIGIALAPEHGEEVDVLLRHADVAMYSAKASRAGHAVYDTRLDANSAERLALGGELRRAIDHDELVVHYQPKVDMTTRCTSGAEALVRWQHPRRGLLGPGEFIPLAESTALIKPLTMYVLDRALGQCRRWADAGHELSVAVNISAYHLLDHRLPDDVADVLDRHGVRSHNLELEITETTLMADASRALDVLRRLSAMGVRLSIDDFGTGYSSLSYLKQLPVDAMKIDRSFVMGMMSSVEDATIVQSTIELARNLGLRTVAEGVEDRHSLVRLEQLGCDLAQGFYLSRPVSADEFLAFVTREPAGAPV